MAFRMQSFFFASIFTSSEALCRKLFHTEPCLLCCFHYVQQSKMNTFDNKYTELTSTILHELSNRNESVCIAGSFAMCQYLHTNVQQSDSSTFADVDFFIRNQKYRTFAPIYEQNLLNPIIETIQNKHFIIKSKKRENCYNYNIAFNSPSINKHKPQNEGIVSVWTIEIAEETTNNATFLTLQFVFVNAPFAPRRIAEWGAYVVDAFDISVCKCWIMKTDNYKAQVRNEIVHQDLENKQFHFQLIPGMTFVKVLSRLAKYTQKGFCLTHIDFKENSPDTYKTYITSYFCNLYGERIVQQMFQGNEHTSHFVNNAEIQQINDFMAIPSYMLSRLWLTKKKCQWRNYDEDTIKDIERKTATRIIGRHVSQWWWTKGKPRQA